MVQQEFEKQISGFKCEADLHFFLMNVLSLITYDISHYCEYEKFEGLHTD